jgi:hypothetical protein
VLVEGLSERLMLPVIIGKLEEADESAPKLSSQYTTVMEVGGAYAHIFLDLLDFLELRSLVITDLDSVLVAGGKACAVHLGTSTSNACIKSWFGGPAPLALADIIAKDDASKMKGRNRIAFQCAEAAGGPCGRTFEDAFILANAGLFGVTGATSNELELNAREMAGNWKKSEFALTYAISETTWTPPKYIREGIQWLAAGDVPATDEALALVVEAAAPALDAVMPAGVPDNG